MRHKNEILLYGVSALLLLGAGSLWWQGVRPLSRRETAVIRQIPPDAAGILAPHPGTGAGDSPVAAPPAESKAPATIFVHVAGAVTAPGVYELREGQRVYEAIALAGPAEDADLDALNLAGLLRDSQKVYVPKEGEPEQEHLDPDRSTTSIPPARTLFPINVNTATARELEELPGIGPVLAEAIIATRRESGPFARAEDLKTVPGIGEKTYARIAPLVKVE